MLIDPHTATGTLAARRLAGEHPVVTMATAHPAKFPDAVERATGIRPALPEHLADLFDRPERTETVPNDLAIVEDYVARVSRVRASHRIRAIRCGDPELRRSRDPRRLGTARYVRIGTARHLGWRQWSLGRPRRGRRATSAACLAPSRS